jgi:hypothetical protein
MAISVSCFLSSEPHDEPRGISMSCPICERRPPKRFCPAKGEKICAICCGREREVTIDCPSGCPYLVTARRYETEHRKPISFEEFPYPDVEFLPEFVHERWTVVSGLATAILAFQIENQELNDGAVLASLEALAETYRTLGTGIYYERPPDASLARALYHGIARFVQDFQAQEAERRGFSSLKESELFRLLVFLLRVGKRETNGRSRSRAFLDFLRSQFPLPQGLAKGGPRIIVP